MAGSAVHAVAAALLCLCAVLSGCQGIVLPHKTYTHTFKSSDVSSSVGVYWMQTRGIWAVAQRASVAESFAAGDYAYILYNEVLMSEGWHFLSAYTNPVYPDLRTAEAVGYLEGLYSAASIYNSAVNTDVFSPVPQSLTDFVSKNNDWMSEQITSAKKLFPVGHPKRVYWEQVELVLVQMHGIYLGYSNSSISQTYPMTEFQILHLNLFGDLEDLLSSQQEVPPTPEELALLSVNQHCSAFLRLLDNNSDLYIAQDAWSSFNSMLRIYKLYDMPFHLDDSNLVPGRRTAFSSYPAVVNSGDDFYVISSGLVVQETTIGNSNPDLVKKITPESVLEYIRNVVANRLATDGQSWIDVYSLYNSGTYNNQNMILDFNKFVPGQPLVPGTFFICEQIPGMIRSHDMSQMLQDQRYFGSYNVAYDPEIRTASGLDGLEQQFGPWFSWNMTARAQIFRREAPNVNGLDDMKRLMRLNDYTHDPLSTQLDTCKYRGFTNCTPAYTAENTIACRCDLNPADGVWGFPSFAQRNHAAIDAKMTSFSLFDKVQLTSVIINGPTYDQVPPFKFSTSPYANLPHNGLPDLVLFPWETVSFP